MSESPSDRWDYAVVLLIVGGVMTSSILSTFSGELNLVSDMWAWLEIAESTVEGGHPLYLNPNQFPTKPPLWQYFNILAYASGYPVVIHYLALSVFNMIGSVLLYAWVRQHTGKRVPALVAAALFASLLPHIGGHFVNVRSPALVAILGALYVSSSWKRGVLMAIAGLFLQYAVLGIPIVAWDGIRSSDRDPKEWLPPFVGAGLGTVAIVYASVGVIWGLPSLVEGVKIGLNMGTRSLSAQPACNSLVDPYNYFNCGRSAVMNLMLLVVGIFAGLGIWLQEQDPDLLLTISVALTVLYGLPLLIKTLGYYFLLPTAFGSVVVSLTFNRYVEATSTE